MASPRRAQINIPSTEAPPKPTDVDMKIARNQGSTLAIETTAARLEASKSLPTPSLSDLIYELTRQNGHLRQEVAYHVRKDSGTLYLEQEAKYLLERLRMALITFAKMRQEARDEFCANGLILDDE